MREPIELHVGQFAPERIVRTEFSAAIRQMRDQRFVRIDCGGRLERIAHIATGMIADSAAHTASRGCRDHIVRTQRAIRTGAVRMAVERRPVTHGIRNGFAVSR